VQWSLGRRQRSRTTLSHPKVADPGVQEIPRTWCGESSRALGHLDVCGVGDIGKGIERPTRSSTPFVHNRATRSPSPLSRPHFPSNNIKACVPCRRSLRFLSPFTRIRWQVQSKGFGRLPCSPRAEGKLGYPNQTGHTFHPTVQCLAWSQCRYKFTRFIDTDYLVAEMLSAPLSSGQLSTSVCEKDACLFPSRWSLSNNTLG